MFWVLVLSYISRRGWREAGATVRQISFAPPGWDAPHLPCLAGTPDLTCASFLDAVLRPIMLHVHTLLDTLNWTIYYCTCLSCNTHKPPLPRGLVWLYCCLVLCIASFWWSLIPVHCSASRILSCIRQLSVMHCILKVQRSVHPVCITSGSAVSEQCESRSQHT